MTAPRVLVTGATGYIGGRLYRALEGQGFEVRCMARRPEHLRSQVSAGTTVVAGDVMSRKSLEHALEGVDVAFYLVHSMGSDDAFEHADRVGAENFAQAARRAGVGRIIYVGALGDSERPLSPHLRSRHEVGNILRDSGVPTIELRASIVIGSGSLSFEMIRALVERLPVMVTPRWVSIEAQPVAIEDVLKYLRAAIDVEISGDGIYEIGGRDVVTYGDLMREYARQRGLRRWMIPVPVLTPRLSSLWLGLITPLFARVGRKLIESIQHSTVVRDDRARAIFGVDPLGVRAAVRRALVHEDSDRAATRWSDALSSAGAVREWGGVRFGNRLVDARSTTVQASADAAFRPIRRIGGPTGWCHADWLWTARGAIDLLLGGVGMRRGRANPSEVREGAPLDCWRVERLEPNRRLLLRAEMKLPGRAWLEFEVQPNASGTTISQTAIFDPIGLRGLAYWYGVFPLHEWVFGGMIRRIGQEALRAENRVAP